MGLFESIIGTVADAVADTVGPALIKTVMGSEGVAGVLSALRAAGFDSQVQSWLGSGKNLAIGVEQLRSALDSDLVRHLAESLNIPFDDVLAFLAEKLPAAVDQMSPAGILEDTPAA